MDVFDAAERYQGEGRQLVILAGKDYGSGSSRDWAAKGPWILVHHSFFSFFLFFLSLQLVQVWLLALLQSISLQGVRAVIAESYERIHRSNLIGMGILPLQFLPGESAESLKLTGKESYSVNVPADISPGQIITVNVSSQDD